MSDKTKGNSFSPSQPAVLAKPSPSPKYREDFANGPGGWWGWAGNHEGFREFELAPSAIISRSPWWIDYNHAPPGAGYLHMICCLNTSGPMASEAMTDLFGPNAFVKGGYPRNFVGAKLTVRLKGELLPRGANLVLLAQSTIGSINSGWALTGQPLKVTPDWSEQTITAIFDPAQWSCLGSRHSRTDYYGRLPLDKVLQDVNCNIMLILFPLKIVPMGPARVERDELRAGRDYPVWRSELPEGYVMIDRVEIAFSPGAGP